MRTLERRMARYEGSIMEPIPPVLGVGERELILVTHDKCSFCANDGKKEIWMHDEKMPLRKKGNGKSIMVSEFLLEVCERLQLSEEEKKNPNIPAEACSKFPNAMAVFGFDNSMNHLAFADDALLMQRMNKGLGGKQSRKTQRNKKSVREKKSIERRIKFGMFNSAIVKLIEGAGHICIFYPKFHCELNFIEMYWSAAKRKFARKSWRYMELYHKGLTGKLAEQACKKFKSYRQISQKELTLFLQENGGNNI
ncbi:23268_t:CDS:2 [Cetraspora pellucida]|uniref:23268_t:CDS:1 n=1 Tax=Cetraspora pellucida TaxID=1433469 RepID=A0A9N9D3D9_9GLOM|nr:23268_t:CDS:2 [Cetraspora pellucida]